MPGKCFCFYSRKEKGILDSKIRMFYKSKSRDFGVSPWFWWKNLKFFHVFIFCKRHPAKCVWQYSRIYKEQQAIPSVHGIHRVEFLLMLLILQFHGLNLSLCVKDNVTTHFSSASNLKNICFFPHWFVHSQNHGNYKRLSCLGKGKVITECSAKINVNHYKQIRKLRNSN